MEKELLQTLCYQVMGKYLMLSWYSSTSDVATIKINSSIVSPILILGFMIKIPGTWRPWATWSVRCGGIDVRLFVTNTNPCSSHQIRMSGSRVLFAGAPSSPTAQTINSGSCRRSWFCKEDRHFHPSNNGWSLALFSLFSHVSRCSQFLLAAKCLMYLWISPVLGYPFPQTDNRSGFISWALRCWWLHSSQFAKYLPTASRLCK